MRLEVREYLEREVPDLYSVPILRELQKIDRLRERVAELEDKALRFDLDRAGIERREIEATELVDARAEIARLCKRVANLESSCDGYTVELDAERARTRIAQKERDEARAQLADSVPVARVREVLLESEMNLSDWHLARASRLLGISRIARDGEGGAW